MRILFCQLKSYGDIIRTFKTADNVRLMAKGEKINAPKLNRNFNDLLLDNENKKNPLNQNFVTANKISIRFITSL